MVRQHRDIDDGLEPEIAMGNINMNLMGGQMMDDDDIDDDIMRINDGFGLPDDDDDDDFDYEGIALGTDPRMANQMMYKWTQFWILPEDH